MQRKHVYAVAAVLLAALTAASAWEFYAAREAARKASERQSTTASARRDTIGGSFTLTDHTGRRVSDADFRGKFLLIFFGYTYCPDVCPTAMANVSLVMEELGSDAAEVQPLFISVDPERDDPAELADFVGQFDPRIVGLTGTPEEIAEVARKFRVYYRKVTAEELGGEASDGADDYLMDHSAYVYLMGPDGGFIEVFSHTEDPAEVARAVREAIRSRPSA